MNILPAATLTVLALVLCTCAPALPPPPLPPKPPQPANETLVEQVRETERAFARTMADRDHAGFMTFLSSEAVFLSGEKPLRGAREVGDSWKPLYEGPEAPFSWEPQDVVVLDSGTLALSSGPVHDPAGKLIGTYTSIWRLEEPGRWRIVFDKGNEVCESEK